MRNAPSVCQCWKMERMSGTTIHCFFVFFKGVNADVRLSPGGFICFICSGPLLDAPFSNSYVLVWQSWSFCWSASPKL